MFVGNIHYISDLLIVKFHHPALIIILVYCPPTKLYDIILKTKSYIMYFPSTLPNIIMLGDLNFPNINWSCSITSCPIAGPFRDLSDLLFLNQQVKEPTHKVNIVYIIFCHGDLVNYITTTDTFLFDHQIINVTTSIPVPQTIPMAQSLNSSSNVFNRFD